MSIMALVPGVAEAQDIAADQADQSIDPAGGEIVVAAQRGTQRLQDARVGIRCMESTGSVLGGCPFRSPNGGIAETGGPTE